MYAVSQVSSGPLSYQQYAPLWKVPIVALKVQIKHTTRTLAWANVHICIFHQCTLHIADMSPGPPWQQPTIYTPASTEHDIIFQEDKQLGENELAMLIRGGSSLLSILRRVISCLATMQPPWLKPKGFSLSLPVGTRSTTSILRPVRSFL